MLLSSCVPCLFYPWDLYVIDANELMGKNLKTAEANLSQILSIHSRTPEEFLVAYCTSYTSFGYKFTHNWSLSSSWPSSSTLGLVKAGCPGHQTLLWRHRVSQSVWKLLSSPRSLPGSSVCPHWSPNTSRSLSSNKEFLCYFLQTWRSLGLFLIALHLSKHY